MGKDLNLGGKLKHFDDIFGTTTKEHAPVENSEGIVFIDVDRLDPFPNHPFKLYKGEKLENLCESIKKVGILTPLLVRKWGDRYQILSGHNRHNAATIVGLEKVKCIVLDVDDHVAALIVVESNFRQRDEMLPSEKAFGFKMKLDALRHQGKIISSKGEEILKGKKSRDLLGEEIGDSGIQVQRYIRLTELIAEILDMVDEGKIGFNTGVELSYLKREEQMLLSSIITEENIKIKLAQASKLKRISQKKQLESDEIVDILCNETPKRKALKLNPKDIKKYFPEEIGEEEILSHIIKALDMMKQNNGM